MNSRRLGTRASLLARTQSGGVGRALAEISGCEYEEILITTPGDDTSTSLNQPGRPGLFVSTLRQALINGDVDVIVHSYKDLPSAPFDGILLACIPIREDVRDGLVSRDGVGVMELAEGAVVGTSSPRRAAALLAMRPDLIIKPIRGNIDTRIRKVREGEFDASVLAMAGVTRIGRANEIVEIFDPTVFVPAPAQGALAVECRSDDLVLVSDLLQLEDSLARVTTSAERAVLVGISAACTTPVGAYATVEGDELTLLAEIAAHENFSYVKVEESITLGDDPVESALELGHFVASRLIEEGRIAH